MSKISVIHRSADGLIAFWCPGCGDAHVINTQWRWNGDYHKPTITPSVLVNGVQREQGSSFHRPNHVVPDQQETVCHSFVEDGKIHFLEDSTHILAGTTVDLPEWKDEEAK